MYIASNGVKTAVILRDPVPTSPRDPDYQENITNMVCWHSRYRLGDQHDYMKKDPHDFAADMVDKHVSTQDVMKAIVSGELSGLRAVDEGKDGILAVDCDISITPGKRNWARMDWGISKDTHDLVDGACSFVLENDVLDNCYEDELMQLCEKYGNVAVLPLYLYDHSGLSMSTGSFIGRAQHAEWDSGQVGYIYMDKETAMKNLALPGDKVNIAMLREGKPEKFSRETGHSVDDTLAAQGFLPVRRWQIKNLEDPETNSPRIDIDLLKRGDVYKKGHTLYAFAGHELDGEFLMKPIGTFNPDLKPLSEETWRARAEEILKADVKEYDSYLRGDVYGFETYEGLDMVDSCWGFNPCGEDIEDIMNDELSGWFGSDMDFEFSYDSDFDIDDYFQENNFPELRGEIRKLAEAHLHHQKEPFPYKMSYSDIVNNKDSVLDNVVEALYEVHRIPDAQKIHETFQEYAGISRAVQPKLSAADLEPGKEYTADDLMAILQTKPSLDSIIAGAAGRAGKQPESGLGKVLPEQQI